MAQMVINQKLASIHPIQLENFNRDFEALLDGIAYRDYGMVAMLCERYHIAPNGILERIITRLMAISKDPVLVEDDLGGLRQVSEDVNFEEWRKKKVWDKDRFPQLSE